MSLGIYGGKPSRAFRVLWLAEELGLDYTHHSERPHSETIRGLNPLGQIPVLRDGDTVLTDSLAIMNYLADRAGRLTYPAGSVERARMDARINFVLTEMEAPVWMAARHSFVLPEERRHPEIKPWLKDDFQTADERFRQLIGSEEHFAGLDFTIADIVAAHTIRWALAARFPVSDELKDYLSRTSDRPAFAKLATD